MRKDGTQFWANVVIAALYNPQGELTGFSKITRDLTARKQAEENSRRLIEEATARRVAEENSQLIAEQRERLHTTIASIGDAVICTDAEGRVEFLNPVAQKLTGWNEADAVGHYLPEVFHIVNEQTRREVENPALKALREGHVIGLANHTILISKDGHEYPIDDSAAPIRYKNNEMIGSVLVFRDISERRSVEKVIQERELRYRLVGEAANDAIWDWDLRSDEVVWNEGLQRVFGYREQDVGKHADWWLENIHPDDRERISAHIHRAIDEGESVWQNEYRYRRADGTYAAVIDRGRIVHENGMPIRMVGSMLDLTERNLAEAALKAAEERFEFVRKSSGVGFWYCDLPFETLQWDEIVKSHFHLPADAKVTIETFYEHIHPEDREATRAAIERSIEAHKPYDFFYRTINPATSAEKWVRAIGRTTYTKDGSPIRFDGVTLDVTEQKRIEKELREVAAALSEAAHRKDEFLATLAHELRNPLAPMSNALQLMQLSSKHEILEQSRKVLQRQLAQMVRLVDDLLDLSRITRGKLDLRMESLALSSVITSAVETSRPLIDQMRHELLVSLPTQSILINADMTRLSQVFSNLLNNAAKYSEAAGRIEVIGIPEEDQVSVHIRDRGIGISAEQLPRIFEMFAQVDQSLERSQGGLGIGLTLVKKLVEMHGGSVEAKSDGLGRGSEFVVRLPIQSRTNTASSERKAPTAKLASSHRILIVDDNRDGAESLAMMLNVMGNETRVAFDGEEAVHLADSYRPDVMLLDIGLPKLNGYEVCRMIRQKRWSESLVLIAVTGWGQEHDRRRAKDAGFDHHLTKPVAPQFLVQLLAGLNAKG